MPGKFSLIRVLPITIVMAIIVSVGFIYHFQNLKNEKYLTKKGFINLSNFESILINKIHSTQEQFISDTKLTTIEESFRSNYNRLLTNKQRYFLFYSLTFLKRLKGSLDKNEINFNIDKDKLEKYQNLKLREDSCFRNYYTLTYPELRKKIDGQKCSELNEYLIFFSSLNDDLPGGKKLPSDFDVDESEIAYNIAKEFRLTDLFEQSEKRMIPVLKDGKIHFITRKFSVKEDNSVSEEDFYSLNKYFVDFVQDIINPEVFENVFLFDTSEVFINTNKFLEINRVDSLLSTINTEHKNNSIFEYAYAGEPYLLFIIPFNGLEQELYLGGMISKSSFSSLSRKVNPILVTLVIFILILIIVFFPVWKLIFMNEYDELDRADVYLIGLSIFAGTYFLITVVINIYLHFDYNQGIIKKNLENLSGKVNAEINQTFKQSKNHLIDLNTKLKSIKAEDKANFQTQRERFYSYDSVKNKNLPGIYDSAMQQDYLQKFNIGIFIDKYGHVMFINSLINGLGTDYDLSRRDYFRNALEENANYFDNEKDRQFYFQSIYSYSNDQNEFAISMPADSNAIDARVIAVTHNLLNLLEPVLTTGYGYTMIDRTGKVLLHSDKRKILRENFLSECENNILVRDIIKNNQRDFARIRYNGKDYFSYITPVDDVYPYFLVTFFDMRQLQSMDTRINLYMVSMLGLNLVIIGFLILVTLLVFNKKHHLFDVKFIHAWLLYHPTNRYKYLYLCSVYLVFFLLYISIGSAYNNVLSAICFSWLIIIGTSIINFTVLNGFSWKKLIKKDSRDNYISKILGIENISFYYFIYLILIVFISILLINDHVKSGISIGSIVVFVFIIIYILMAVFAYLFRDRILTFFTSLTSRFDWIKKPILFLKNSSNPEHRTEKLYISFYLLWIALVCIVPCFHYNKVIFNKESEIRNFKEVTDIAAKFNRKYNSLAAYYKKSYKIEDDSLRQYIFQPNLFKDTPAIRDNHLPYALNTDFCGFMNEDSIEYYIGIDPDHEDIKLDTISLHNSIFKTLRIIIPALNEEHYSTLNYRYQRGKGNTESDTLTIATDLHLRSPFAQQKMYAKIHKNKYLHFLPISGYYDRFDAIILILLTIIALVFCLWKAMEGILKNVTFFRFDELFPFNSNPRLIKKKYADVHLPEGNYNPSYVFFRWDSSDESTQNLVNHIIENPKVAKRAIAEYDPSVKSQKFEVVKCVNCRFVKFRKDHLMINNATKVDSNSDHILFLNFDYDISNPQVFKERLKILEWLYTNPKINVTITSNFGVDRYQEVYEEIRSQYLSNSTKYLQLERSWNRWVFLFRKFKEGILPIRFEYQQFNPSQEDGDRKSSSFQIPPDDSIYQEEFEKEQNDFSLFYWSIWVSLSQKEQIMLLDVAKDGIVNIRNKQAIQELIKKGLLKLRDKDQHGHIRENPILKFGRNSFKSYVLQLSAKGKTKDLIKSISKKGNWASMRSVILIFIIALVVFLAFFEQAIFDRFLAIVGASAAVIPLLIRIGQTIFVKKATES